jgi:hypothetical protein
MIARIRPGSNPRHKAASPSTRSSAGRSGMNILDAVHDDRLFWPWFSKRPSSWAAWFAFLAALFALDMTPEQLKLYQQCTGRKKPPTAVARACYLICGRRSGKSFILALVAVFLACFFDFREFLSRGERCTVMVIASDRRQARTIIRYVRALLEEVPFLHKMVERDTTESFDLNNRVTIEVQTASLRSVRGYTIACALLDEAAFFQSDENSSSPDREIVTAIRPAMATIPNAMLLVASSPYARKGILFEAWRDHFAKEGHPTLVWQAPTSTMNPTIRQSEIDEAYADDPIAAAAEWGGLFRSDIESYISIEALEPCISEGLFERPRVSGITYQGFIDPSGGSGQDSFTLGIGHFDKPTGIAIVDAIRERKPPFSPQAVIEEYAALLKSYGVTKIIGDKFAGEFAREPFRAFGITYDPSAKPKSDLYRDTLPLINSRKVDLLDNKRMIQQFIGLERRTARSGKDSIDHGPNQHDDIANCVAGLIATMKSKPYRYESDLFWVTGENEDLNAEWRAEGLRHHLLFGGRGLFR